MNIMKCAARRAHPSRCIVFALAAGVIAALFAVLFLAMPLSSFALAQDAEKEAPAEKAEEKKPEEKKAEEKKDAETTGEAAKAEKTEKTETKDGAEAAKPGDEPKGEANEVAAAAADGEETEKERDPPVFRLRDGTRITGTPQLEKVTVDTPYGQLVVPVADLVRIRFAAQMDPELGDRIKEHIARLGDEEFEEREKAMAALLEIGEPALKDLKAALESDDEEITSRARTLVGEIESGLEEEIDDEEDEAAMPIRGEDDEVVTLKFTAKGRVQEGTFQVQSNYGGLLVHRKDIVSIVFQDHAPATIELDVPGTYYAAANNWFQTKIAVEKGETLTINAGGQIFLQNYGYNTGPEGTTQTSTKHFQSFALGALVARIGKSGKPFLVGKKFRGPANAKGKLMFAIAFRSGTVTGSYQVKVERESEE